MPAEFLESLLSLAFPVVCEICGEPASITPPSGVCGICESEIKLIPGPHCVSCGRTLKTQVDRCSECWDKHFHFDRAFACAPYEGHMKELLHAYKFNGRKYLKNFFIRIMRRFLTDHEASLEWEAVAEIGRAHV